MQFKMKILLNIIQTGLRNVITYLPQNTAIDNMRPGKIALLNLINHHLNIDKIYLYAKHPYEAKYQLLVKKCEKIVVKHFKDLKPLFILAIDAKDVKKY